MGAAMSEENPPGSAGPGPRKAIIERLPARWLRRLAIATSARLEAGGPVVRGMLWLIAAGVVLTLLNATLRLITQSVDPLQTLFVRYLAGTLVMLPVALRGGLGDWEPRRIGGHFLRGGLHTIGLMMWFSALPHVLLADVTAIGFTGPIFLMLGAALFLREQMVLARWVAAGIGFAGVLIVVGPGFSGSGGYYLVMMLATSPVFAASLLMTKRMARNDSPTQLVFWQSVAITVCAAPAAFVMWQPMSGGLWLLFALSGLMGSIGHYCMTRSFHRVDISATQSARYLDLVWASLFGLLFFGDMPAATTLLGGAVILASTLWIAQREARTPVARST
jgi:drug/metabolite transporter (DMT)-like permease